MEAVDTIFKVFWYNSTTGMNPKSTNCKADTLTTTPSHQLHQTLMIIFNQIALASFWLSVAIKYSLLSQKVAKTLLLFATTSMCEILF